MGKKKTEKAKWKKSDLLGVTNAITTEKVVKVVDNAIRVIPDFPKEGATFRDVTTVWNDADAFRYSISGLQMFLYEHEIDKIAAIEARGFVYGAALADRLNRPFVPIRRKGKLPGKVVQESYDLEYGKDTLEVHDDAIKEGDKVVLVDDLIVTGSSTAAAARLVKQLGGEVVMILALIDLDGFNGKASLRKKGYTVNTIITYPGK